MLVDTNAAIVRLWEGPMGYVQIPEELRAVIDDQVASGLAPSESAFLAEAVRLYADYLAAGAEVLGLVERADNDMAAGRFTTVDSAEDTEALHRRTMGRVTAALAGDR
jgi:Arc/MetJ-type ribon-helix-helix transcriptional regulator